MERISEKEINIQWENGARDSDGMTAPTRIAQAQLEADRESLAKAIDETLSTVAPGDAISYFLRRLHSKLEGK